MEQPLPLLQRREGAVLVLSNNNPAARNALSPAFYAALTEALAQAEADPTVGAIVLTGEGGHFCAGGDLRQLAKRRELPVEERRAKLEGLHDLIRTLRDCPKPVIVAVEGAAAGAGLSLALAADMRFAGKSARMTTAFAKVGFSGDFGSHYFLHKLVGTAKARELYFTAEILNAEQIEKLGLANRVVDDANLDSETMAFAKKLAAGPRVAWWHVKKNMKVAEEGSLSEALDSEAARMIRTGETEDHKEAARAFVEKRAPVFKGV